MEPAASSDKNRIQELEREIAEIKRRWPPHSVPSSLLRRLDEMEDELAREKKEDR